MSTNPIRPGERYDPTPKEILIDHKDYGRAQAKLSELLAAQGMELPPDATLYHIQEGGFLCGRFFYGVRIRGCMYCVLYAVS